MSSWMPGERWSHESQPGSQQLRQGRERASRGAAAPAASPIPRRSLVRPVNDEGVDACLDEVRRLRAHGCKVDAGIAPDKGDGLG